MKKRSLCFVFGLCLTASAFLIPARAAEVEPRTEWGAGFQVYSIGLGDINVYKFGIGADVQARKWISDGLGWSAGLGVAQWEADSSVRQWRNAPLNGSLRMVPFGGSMLLRTAPDAPHRFVAEAGVRYVVTDSDLRLKPDGAASESVKVDDGVVGVLGLDLEQDWGSSIVSFGLQYQFDLLTGDATFADGQKKPHNLEAASVRIGIRRPF